MAGCLRVRRRRSEKFFRNWAAVGREISDCGEREWRRGGGGGGGGGLGTRRKWGRGRVGSSWGVKEERWLKWRR